MNKMLKIHEGEINKKDVKSNKLEDTKKYMGGKYQNTFGKNRLQNT